jgi:hypothetical protein
VGALSVQSSITSYDDSICFALEEVMASTMALTCTDELMLQTVKRKIRALCVERAAATSPMQCGLDGGRFWRAQAFLRMENLSLQVGELDEIVVDDGKAS